MADAGAWHGWAFGETAAYITPTPDEEHIGLYLQQGRSTELAAVFVDPAMGQLFMDWMDSALQATGEANTELVRRLQTEQPLLFAQPGAPRALVEDDVDEEADRG